MGIMKKLDNFKSNREEQPSTRQLSCRLEEIDSQRNDILRLFYTKSNKNKIENNEKPCSFY